MSSAVVHSNNNTTPTSPIGNSTPTASGLASNSMTSSLSSNVSQTLASIKQAQDVLLSTTLPKSASPRERERVVDAGRIEDEISDLESRRKSLREDVSRLDNIRLRLESKLSETKAVLSQEEDVLAMTKKKQQEIKGNIEVLSNQVKELEQRAQQQQSQDRANHLTAILEQQQGYVYQPNHAVTTPPHPLARQGQRQRSPSIPRTLSKNEEIALLSRQLEAERDARLRLEEFVEDQLSEHEQFASHVAQLLGVGDSTYSNNRHRP